MADASSSGSAARNAAEPGAMQLEARERLISRSLKSSREKLWVQSQAFAERSRIRTARGDHGGALRDAKRALALFPNRVEYLIRAAEALLDCVHGEQASKAAQKAENAIEAAGEDSINVELRLFLAQLNKRLRPFDQLPNEVLATIFELVYSDWEHLPSPFQLCHVSRRWREVAFATPTLWRDTRILRVAVRIATTKDEHCDRVKRPPSFAHEAIIPPSHESHPKTSNHLRLLDLCDKLSRSTIRHFEYHTHQSDGDLAEAMFASICKSAATLRSISVINKDVSVNDSDHGIAWQALALILRCPKLVDLEFSAGSIWSNDRETLEGDLAHAPASTSASLRTVKLDVEDCENLSRLPLARQTFLLRASQVRSLSLVNVTNEDDDEEPTRFAGELLATCAASLEELNAAVCSDLFDAAREAGVTVFPSLKHLRHAPTEDEDETFLPIYAPLFPKLETLAAPLRVVRGFGKLPARVVLRIFKGSELRSICEWLKSLDDNEAPQHLTLELVCRRDLDTRLKGFIDVMTPSIAGKVVCPRLATLGILCKDALRQQDIDGNVFDFDFVPGRKPITRDQWEDLLDVSRLVRVEAERRRVSQGLPIQDDQPARLPPAIRRGAASVCSEQESRTEETTTILPRCEELRSITIESCFIKKTAWDSMKTSACAFTATPDPYEMAKLPWERGKAVWRSLDER